MCGIVGIISCRRDGLTRANYDGFVEAWKRAQARGSHACGLIASVQGNLEFWKDAIPSSEAVKHMGEIIPYRKGMRFMLGHTRFATSGSPDDNLNNHPLVIGANKDLLGIHNGIIANKSELLQAHGWKAQREVDTEIAFRLVNHYGPHSVKPYEQMQGLFNLAFARRNSPGVFYLVRKGNPLVMRQGVDATAFSSMESYWEFPAHRVREVDDNTMTQWGKLGPNPKTVKRFKPVESWFERGMGYARKAPRASSSGWHELDEDDARDMRETRNLWD